MVKVHELDVCGGVAGKLVRVDGVMIHNTSDDMPALEHAERLRKASFEQLMKGFAHYFIDDKDDVRTEQTFNATYHSANYNGNYFLISIEIVGGVNSDKKKFLQAEQNAFWRAAIELRYYKLPVNRKTVRLHCELDVGTYTQCPKRSMIEHGDWNSANRQSQRAINKVKDYYIKEIKKYYDNPKLQPGEKLGGVEVVKPKEKSPLAKETHKPRQMVRSYWFPKGHQKLWNLKNYCERNKIYFTESVVAGQVRVNMMWFQQNSPSKTSLIKYLEENNLNYDIKLEFYEDV